MSKKQFTSDEQSALDTCQTLLSSLKQGGDAGLRAFNSVLHRDGSMCHARYDRGQGVFFQDLKTQLQEHCARAFDGSVVMEEVIDGDATVLVDHDIAMVWTPYWVRYDGELSHVGTNCFNLVKICAKEGEVPGEGNWEWKIVLLSDTARKATADEKKRLDKEYAA